jgi:hypothetical protein
MRYLIRLMVFAILLCLFGCESPSKWQQGKLCLEDYKCSPEQFEAVTKEYELCQTTSYLDSYCFASAKATLCEKIETRQ